MKKCREIFTKLQKIDSWIIGIAMIAMIAVVFIQTFCRFVIFKSLTWSEELSRYLFVAIIMLGINITTSRHMMVRIEIIDNYIKGKGQVVLNIIRKGVALVICLFMVYSSIRMIQITGSETSPAMAIPMRLLYVICLIGFVLEAAAIIFDTYDYLNSIEETNK